MAERKTPHALRGFIGGVLLALVLGGLTLAALLATTGRQSAAHPQATQRQDALTVGRDPETGRLRSPTPAEREKLAPVAPPVRAPEARHVVRRADGAVGMRAPAHMRSYSVVHVRPDGRREPACVNGLEAAAEFVADAADGENHCHAH